MRLWLLMATLVCLGFPARADENLFRNPTAEFQMTKPDGWVYLTAQQNSANLKGVENADADLRSAMERYATAPMVVIAKYPEPFDDLNPSFKVNVRPMGSFAGSTPKAILAAILPSLQRAFPDAAVVQAPEDVKVGGLDGAHIILNYTLRAQGRAYPTASELWVVPRGDFFFMIGAGLRQDEATGTRAEIVQILESIRFGP